MRKQPYLAGLSENMQKNTKNAKNAISPNSFGRKLKNGLSYIGTFRIQELANGDLGPQKKFKKRGAKDAVISVFFKVGGGGGSTLLFR